MTSRAWRMASPSARTGGFGLPQRLRTKLAIALYAQGALSLGKAAELAETNRMIFGEMIAQRGIARHYGDAELVQDVSYARSE